MKKLILCISFLSVAPSQATMDFSRITTLLANPTTKKATLVGFIAWYLFYFKSKKGSPDRNEWTPANLCEKFGQENYITEELIGNPKKTEEIEISTTENGITTTKKDKKTIFKEYGLFGTFDAIVLSKLKDIVDLIKNFEELNKFLAK